MFVICSAVGGTLADALGLCKNIQMPEERVVFYSAQLVLGLAHLHSMGLIYRDLKPSNILLFVDGYVKLADLGGVVDVGGKVLGDRFTERESSVFRNKPKDGSNLNQIHQILSCIDSTDIVSKAFKMGQNSKHSIEPRNATATLPTLEQSIDVPSTDSKLKDSPAPSIRRARSIMGTGGYMAPEVCCCSYCYCWGG